MKCQAPLVHQRVNRITGGKMEEMQFKSLQDKLDQLGNPAEFLRNVPVGAYAYPVRAEYTNWRDEQRSWRETVGLLDQSLHMTDLYLEGPDALRLLSEVGVNSFSSYGRN